MEMKSEEAITKWIAEEEGNKELTLETNPSTLCTSVILRCILGKQISREEAVSDIMKQIGERKNVEEEELSRWIGLVGEFKKFSSSIGCWFEASWIKKEMLPECWREKKEEIFSLERAIKV